MRKFTFKLRKREARGHQRKKRTKVKVISKQTFLNVNGSRFRVRKWSKFTPYNLLSSIKNFEIRIIFEIVLLSFRFHFSGPSEKNHDSRAHEIMTLGMLIALTSCDPIFQVYHYQKSSCFGFQTDREIQHFDLALIGRFSASKINEIRIKNTFEKM